MGADEVTAAVSATATMRAVVQDVYGEADVLRPDVVARPVPGPGRVLLRIRAAGVDRGAWHLMTGHPRLVRLATGLRTPKDPVLGREAAGVVEQVGAGVTRWAPGDEVFGIAPGCFAEYALARADRITARPDALTPVAAATLPVSGVTALQAVRDHGRVRAGQRVLVLGAAGGVGSFAVAIAVARGAEVTGVCRTAKTGLVRELGAAHVVDHTVDEPTGTYDVVIDTGGNRPLRALRRLLTPRGRLVIVGGDQAGGPLLGGFDRNLRAVLLSPFVGPALVAMTASENAPDLDELAELVTSGAVTPAIAATYPLERTADAMRHLTDGRAAGKVVVTVTG